MIVVDWGRYMGFVIRDGENAGSYIRYEGMKDQQCSFGFIKAWEALPKLPSLKICCDSMALLWFG